MGSNIGNQGETSISDQSKNISSAIDDIDKRTDAAIAASQEKPEFEVISAIDEQAAVVSGEDLFAENLIAILDNAKYDDSGFDAVRNMAELNKVKLSRNVNGLFGFILSEELETKTLTYEDGTTVEFDPIGDDARFAFELENNNVTFKSMSGIELADIIQTPAWHSKVKGWPRMPDGSDFGNWDSTDLRDLALKVAESFKGNSSFANLTEYLECNVYESFPVPPKIVFDFSETELDVILTSMKNKIADKGAATIEPDTFITLLDQVLVDKNPGAMTIAELETYRIHISNASQCTAGLSSYFTSSSGFFKNFQDYLIKVRNTVKSNEGGMEISKYSDETSYINRLWSRHNNHYKPVIAEFSSFIKTDALVTITYISTLQRAVVSELLIRNKFLFNFFDDIKTNTLLAKNHADLLNMYNDWKDDISSMQKQFGDALTVIQDANTKLIEDIRSEYTAVINDLKGLIKKYDKSLSASNKLLADYGKRLGSFTQAEIDRQIEERMRLVGESTAATKSADELAKKKFQIDPRLYNPEIHSSISANIDEQKKKLTQKWAFDNKSSSFKVWATVGSITVASVVAGTGMYVFNMAKNKKKNARISSGGGGHYDGY